MATNMGFLLIAGLGALLFLGRAGATKTVDEDSRLATGQGRGGPMPATPAFDLQSYIAGLFGDMATVPVQPPMKFFYPAYTVVSSSGVPGTTHPPPEIITPTTRVQIGGDGGETITASALAVRMTEQIKKQQFQAAANIVTPPAGETARANRIEEERQRQFARDLIAKNIADQLARNKAVVARTRAEQERLATPVSLAGLPIIVPTTSGEVDEGFQLQQYSETFVISGGMDSPGFAAGDEQPSVITVHEITAAYDIGF